MIDEGTCSGKFFSDKNPLGRPTKEGTGGGLPGLRTERGAGSAGFSVFFLVGATRLESSTGSGVSLSSSSSSDDSGGAISGLETRPAKRTTLVKLSLMKNRNGLSTMSVLKSSTGRISGTRSAPRT